jgi:hypothetical protein
LASILAGLSPLEGENFAGHGIFPGLPDAFIPCNNPSGFVSSLAEWPGLRRTAASMPMNTSKARLRAATDLLYSAWEMLAFLTEDEFDELNDSVGKIIDLAELARSRWERRG